MQTGLLMCLGTLQHPASCFETIRYWSCLFPFMCAGPCSSLLNPPTGHCMPARRITHVTCTVKGSNQGGSARKGKSSVVRQCVLCHSS